MIFVFDFEREVFDGYEMTLFTFNAFEKGISGALAKGEAYKPSKNGVIISFKTESINKTLEKVIKENEEFYIQKL